MGRRGESGHINAHLVLGVETQQMLSLRNRENLLVLNWGDEFEINPDGGNLL